MIYKSFKDLYGKTLEENDEVAIGEINYEVRNNYLSNPCGSNGAIFSNKEVDAVLTTPAQKRAFTKECYGYASEGGDWPTFKMTDYAAATRLILGLYGILEEIPYDPNAPVDLEKMPKPRQTDLSVLDKLVIDPEAKDEIISILKQHDNSDTIFKKWGLGELIKYGKGMTFLFYGNPGTGKTYAANLIAEALNKELLTIGAAEIQTSEPGGANRNIQAAFASAKEGKGKIVFLDECDSLIASRANVGMIIGGEINTLLTEIEKFDGVCILATNRISFMDEALHRRIALIVDFPEPSYEMRLDIWKKILPPKMPLNKDVSLEKLAEYNLTGGLIKNVVLQAARLAAASNSKKVGLQHFTQAMDRANKTKNLMGTDLRLKSRIEAVSDYTKETSQ